MVLQNSGSISLQQVGQEFGASNPLVMSNFYRDAVAGLAAGVSGVPLIGAPLSLSDFFGKAKPVPAAAFYTPGWKYKRYDATNGEFGASACNVSWFTGKTAAVTGITTNVYTSVLSDLTTNYGMATNATNTALYITGYFRPNVTGDWTFRLGADDVGLVWLGSNALTPTNGNVTFSKASAGDVDKVVTLTSNVYYPVVVSYGQTSGGLYLNFSWFPPGSTSNITSGSGYFFDSGTQITTVPSSALNIAVKYNAVTDAAVYTTVPLGDPQNVTNSVLPGSYSSAFVVDPIANKLTNMGDWKVTVSPAAGSTSFGNPDANLAYQVWINDVAGTSFKWSMSTVLHLKPGDVIQFRAARPGTTGNLGWYTPKFNLAFATSTTTKWLPSAPITAANWVDGGITYTYDLTNQYGSWSTMTWMYDNAISNVFHDQYNTSGVFTGTQSIGGVAGHYQAVFGSSAFVLKGFRLLIGQNSPKDITLLGTNDDTTFSTVWTYANSTDFSGYTMEVTTIPNSTSYKKYYLVFRSLLGTSGQMSVTEVRWYIG